MYVKQGFRVLVAALAMTVAVLGLMVASSAAQGPGGGGGAGPGAGPGPGGTAPVEDGLALSTFTTADFSGAGVCATCHTGMVDSTGTDVTVPTHWRSTMMANGAIDPLWQAKVSSEIARAPALQAVIEDKCATCHVPMAFTQAHADGATVTLLGEGLLSPQNALHEAAMGSISCTLCHQVRGENLGLLESFSGHYAIDTSTAPPDRLIYGPYTNPVTQQMRNLAAFTPVFGAHIEDPGHCATCHNLYTPYVLADTGEVAPDLFPEQMVYAEWEHSAYGDGAGSDDLSCQQCHMPLADGGVVIADRPLWLAPREPFYQHHFVGGNVTMLQLLRDNVDALGVRASTAQLEATLARAEAQLQNETATVAVSGATWANGVLSFDVDVTNLAGHKFPSGYPSRRAWLHVVVRNRNGAIFFESGRPMADGSIVGADADANGATFEPHYDLITRADQVQIYEAILGMSDGEVTYTLLQAAQYLKDNRLLPAGFDKGTAGEDIAVYGAAAQDADFVGGQDRVSYALSLRSQPATITVELLYQPLPYAYVQDLLQESTPLVATFESYYAGVSKAPVVVASVTAPAR
jgi:hypothetical protein